MSRVVQAIEGFPFEEVRSMFAFVEELKQCAPFFRHNNERLRADANEKTSEPTKNVIDFGVSSIIEECIRLPKSLQQQLQNNGIKVVGSYEINLDRLKRAKPNPKTNLIEVNCIYFRLNLTRVSSTEYALESVDAGSDHDSLSVVEHHPRVVFERIKQELLNSIKDCEKESLTKGGMSFGNDDYATTLMKQLILLKQAAQRYQMASKDLLAFVQSPVDASYLHVVAQIKVVIVERTGRSTTSHQQTTSSPTSVSLSSPSSSSTASSSPSIDRHAKRTVVLNSGGGVHAHNNTYSSKNSPTPAPIVTTQLSSNTKRKVQYGDGNGASSSVTAKQHIEYPNKNNNKKKKYSHHNNNQPQQHNHHHEHLLTIRKPFIRK